MAAVFVPLFIALGKAILFAAVSFAVSRLLSSLTAPQQSRLYGGSLSSDTREPGTQITVRSAAAPHQIVFGERRVAGNIVFAHCTENNLNLHLVVVWAGHEVAALGKLYFNDEEVTLSGPNATGKYAGHVQCFDFFGGDDQAASDQLIHNCPEQWTAAFRGRGVAYSYIGLGFSRDLYPQGLPNIWRVVRGRKVYDPRDDSTGWSDNAALCTAAWLADPKYGRGIAYADIDLDVLGAAANVCDEEVTLLSGATEKRYTANAVLLSDAAFVDNLEKLLSAMRGTAALIGGRWLIDAAAWQEPTLVLGEGDFRAAFTVTTGIGNAEAFNAIKGKFINPAKLWQPDDFPAIVSSAYEIEDGGDGKGLGREFKDVNLEATTSASMAQRIARIDLREARQPLAFTAPVKLKGLQLRAGDTVAVDNPMLGWAEKPFRVERLRLVTGFAPGGNTGQPGIIGVDLDLRETAEAIYDWDPAIDEIAVDPAPNTTLPDVFNVLAPSNLQAVESLYVTRDGGGVKAMVTLTWDASPDAFVQSGGWYVPEYKGSADSVWSKLPATSATTAAIPDVAAGTYDFRVFAHQWTGARSAMAPTIMAFPVSALSAAPAMPTGLGITAAGGLAIARWDKTADLDVEIGGSIVFRHSALTSGASWADAVSISDPQPGNLTLAVLPLKAGTYLAKFLDSGGRYSADFAAFAQTQTSVHLFSPLSGGSLVEDPGFAGAKSGVFVVDGALQLSGAGLFSDIPLLSAVPSVAFFGGVVASGTYAFAAPIDLGSVRRCRLTVGMSSLVVNVQDRIGSRTTPISTWPDFVGDVSGDEADARVEVRTTQTDPAGVSPTWTGWTRLDSGEFQARGFAFRARLESVDSSFNIRITALAAVAEGV